MSAVQEVESKPYERLSVEPIAGALGAEIGGINLAGPVDAETLDEVKRALREYLVVFFRGQDLTPEQHLAFAKNFGSLEVHPIVSGKDEYPEIIEIVKEKGEQTQFGDVWHSDNSFLPNPSMGSILYAREVPPYGGDTLFANQYLAYDWLSDGMKKLLDGLIAIHTAKQAYDPVRLAHKYRGETNMKYTYSDVVDRAVEHPVVRTHPETGRKSLFVNRMFTTEFKDMSPAESGPILDFLAQHAIRPEFTCRFRWQPGSVAFWDNRCTMHYAMNDYVNYRRVMHRITIEGDRPF
jgi:taurine dioxygenase